MYLDEHDVIALLQKLIPRLRPGGVRSDPKMEAGRSETLSGAAIRGWSDLLEYTCRSSLD